MKTFLIAHIIRHTVAIIQYNHYFHFKSNEVQFFGLAVWHDEGQTGEGCTREAFCGNCCLNLIKESLLFTPCIPSNALFQLCQSL